MTKIKTLCILLMCCFGSVVANAASSFVFYSWQKILMSKNINYNITEVEGENGINQINCARKGGEISVMNISFYGDDGLFADMTQEELLDMCKNMLEDMPRRMTLYSNVQADPMRVDTSKKYPCVTQKYTAKVAGIPIVGDFIVFIQKGHIVLMILQADRSEYYEELKEMVETVRVL